ncbi:MAG: hypothetical protein ACRD2J_16210 [Thermoanaerobaculia bacterium]
MEALGRAGFRVNAGNVTNGAIGEGGEAGDPAAIFARDMAWLEEVAREGGALVAEVTTPSLGVGYEIAAARHRFGIPVVALYRPEASRRCSAMVAGDPGVVLVAYAEGALEEAVEAVARALRARAETAINAGGRGLPG